MYGCCSAPTVFYNVMKALFIFNMMWYDIIISLVTAVKTAFKITKIVSARRVGR